MDKYLRMSFALMELGLPPVIANRIAFKIPLAEIHQTVLDTYEDGLTLGALVDRFRYRDIPIRRYWNESAFAPPLSLAEALFGIVQVESGIGRGA